MYTEVQSLHLTNIITQKFCTLDENLWKFELLEIRTTVIDHQTAQAACAYRTSHGGCYDNGNSASRDRKNTTLY